MHLDSRLHSWRHRLAAVCGACILLSCGGSDDAPIQANCALDEQKSWLARYMDDRYFWYALKSNPDANAFDTIESYFAALLYQGTSVAFPKDRWSFTQSTAGFQQFFGEGKTLGYGVFVAGLEVQGQPSQPLRVRYIEPASPAAGKIARGDTIVSINGKPSSEIIASNDYSVLSAANAGDTVSMVTRNASGERTVTLTATVFSLTPVSTSATLTTPAGRKVGYIVLKDFVSQSLTPLDSAFAQFKAAGVQDVVLDLRYNGGGLVSVAGDLASYAARSTATDQVFASLLFNDKHGAENIAVRFGGKAQALGMSRVYVLAGARTCSASELVINGLKPFAEVVQVGGTTCGKPVGFQPQDRCGITYDAVNFESVNANGQGRYWDGIAPNCAVADDFSKALGDKDEALTAAALMHADTGACPVATQREQPEALRGMVPRVVEPGERQGMWIR